MHTVLQSFHAYYYYYYYYYYYPRDVVSVVLATATWLAGWMSRRYCINTAKNTAKPISKLFRPSGSPIILISSDPCADTQFQGHFQFLQRGR